jgi:redox-sensitive bicupin YhaK (pirin superfamily)
MTSERRIADVFPAPEPHWVGDGFRVMGYFSPGDDFAGRLSPFLLLDYHAPHVYPPTDNLRRGVGPHPHRGFETVTLAFEGSVAHHDSAGNGGVIGPGDVQWMTAASGILHREYHAPEFARRGGTMHMMQICVNLPRAHKADPPGYQGIVADQISNVTLPGDAGLVRVIAGEFGGAVGPARTFTPISMFDVRLNRNGRVNLSFPAHENAALLMMKGEITLDGGTNARENDFVVFANEGESIAVEAQSQAHFLVLAGSPIDEPVAHFGPFVMNTKGEIRQAITDFRNGGFGHLDD